MANVSVSISTEAQTINGDLTLLRGKRLSDFLNERSTGSGGSEVCPFLTINNVEIKHKDGTTETANTLYVNDKVIQILRTCGENDARGAIAETKLYPYVTKQKIKATIYTADWQLTGYLHCNEKQDIACLLGAKKTFISCTDVTIHNIRDNTRENTAFAAVNSNLIFSVKKD